MVFLFRGPVDSRALLFPALLASVIVKALRVLLSSDENDRKS